MIINGRDTNKTFCDNVDRYSREIPMEQPLYKIADEIHSILNAEDWDDTTETALAQLEMSLTAKVDNICAVANGLESRIEACKAEEKRIAALRKSAESKAAWLKQYVMGCLLAAERTEVETATRRVVIKNNPPAAVCDDESLTPAKFLTVVPEQYQPDKKAIKDAIKAGENVPGWHLEQGQRIEFK